MYPQTLALLNVGIHIVVVLQDETNSTVWLSAHVAETKLWRISRGSYSEKPHVADMYQMIHMYTLGGSGRAHVQYCQHEALILIWTCMHHDPFNSPRTGAKTGSTVEWYIRENEKWVVG